MAKTLFLDLVKLTNGTWGQLAGVETTDMTLHTFVTNNQGVKQLAGVELTPCYKQLCRVLRQLTDVGITHDTPHICYKKIRVSNNCQVLRSHI